MFNRLKNAIARIRGKKTDENAENDYDVSYQPEDDALQQKLQEYRTNVTDLLEPVKSNWKFIEDTLLWKNQFPACICFFVISGIFWKFIGMKFRKTALILGAFLLANAISGDVRANCWDFFHRNLHLEVKEQERLPFSFDELCLGIASVCLLYSQSVTFVQDLKNGSPSKLYCFLAVFLFSILTLFTYFPVIEFIYVLVCCLFFYPSLNHYGIMDRIEARMNFFLEPVKKHWENNRTKRMRDLKTASIQDSHVVDTDDEFILDKNAFTTDVLSSMVPEDQENSISMNNEVISDRLINYHDGDTEEEDDFDESHFAQGLSLPSMSKFDSMMEPYDEFHNGLKFPDVNESLALDTERILHAAANNLDTDDEDIDDLPCEDEADSNQRPERNIKGTRGGPLFHPSSDHELRHRSHPHNNENVIRPDRDLPTDVTTEIEEGTRAVEAEFEFLDHDDLYDIDAYNVANTGQKSTNTTNDQPSPTYAQTVSKWFGYE